MGLIAIVVGVVLVAAFTLTVVRRARRPQPWADAADRLARRYDIALTPEVAGRVTRRMRTEYLLSVAMMLPLSFVLGALPESVDGSAHGTSSYAAIVLSLPIVMIVIAGVFALPRWNSVSGPRVSHLVRARVGQIFTRREWLAVCAGVAVTMLAAGWLFWRIDAGAWWLAGPPAAVVTAVAWWSAVRAILQRPAQAGDVVELGWDDVFRYRHARALTILTAWGPAATAVVLVDFVHEPDSLNLIPFYGFVAVAIALNQLFKHGDADQWRSSWS